MSADVMVLGAGLVGIFTALNLAQQGQKVVLIDRGEPGQEASSGNAGVISPWSIAPGCAPGVWRKLPGMLLGADKPLNVQAGFWPKMVPWGTRFLLNGTEKKYRKTANAMYDLCRPSVTLYKDWLALVGHAKLITDSYYIHAFRHQNNANLDALDYAIRAEKGAEMQLVGRIGLAEVEPALAPIYDAAILIKGQARLLSPGRVGTVLAEYACRLGVEIQCADIGHVSREGGDWQAIGQGRVFRASKLVVCAGVWSEKLLRKTGLHIPLVAERGYHLEIPSGHISLNHSVMDMAGKIVASSMKGGLRLAGAAEFAAIDAPPSEWRESLLRRQAARMLPDLDLFHARFWMGSRPSLPDSLPIIGALSPSEGLFGAFGHAHQGVMMAPMTGKVLTDVILGKKPSIDMSPYHPMRFS